PVGEQQHVALAVLGADVLEQAPAAIGRVFESLAAGRPVGEQVPVRTFGANVSARAALVVAVVDLDEQVRDLGHLEAREASGLDRPLARARQNAQWLDAETSKALTEEARTLLPLLRQRDVGATGVASVARPLGFPVTYQHHTLGHSVEP